MVFLLLTFDDIIDDQISLQKWAILRKKNVLERSGIFWTYKDFLNGRCHLSTKDAILPKVPEIEWAGRLRIKEGHLAIAPQFNFNVRCNRIESSVCISIDIFVGRL